MFKLGSFVPGGAPAKHSGAEGPAKHHLSGQKSPAELRIQGELTGMKDIPGNVQLIFPDPNKLLDFKVKIKVNDEDSLWHGATYEFSVSVPLTYPISPPVIKCLTKIYHPNIDLAGNVCLNILRKDWRPILGISVVIFGLLFLFVEPNPDDPLNLEASEIYRNNKSKFVENVKKSLKGKSVDGVDFPKLIN